MPPPRRTTPQSLDNLSPQQDFYGPGSGQSSPSYLNFPQQQSRAPSPSSFTQFLSKPSKWFTRKDSNSRSSSGMADSYPSTNSTRKPKISQPTDPRPILHSFQSDSYIGGSGSVGASPGTAGITGGRNRSVMDLSQTRPSLDGSRILGSPSSPSSRPLRGGLGDLRSISKKGWSRSADDLGKFPSTEDSSFPAKIAQYRNRSNSNHIPLTQLQPSPAHTNNPSIQAFPSIVTALPLSSSPPQESSLAPPPEISCSEPQTINDSDKNSIFNNSSSQYVTKQAHIRTHSFTPRLPSRLANSKSTLSPSTSIQNGSVLSDDRDIDPPRNVERSPSGGLASAPAIANRSGFGFSRVSHLKAPLSSAPVDLRTAIQPVGNALRSSPSLSPIVIIEPDKDDVNENRDKRSSQVLYHSGFLNRLDQTLPPAVLNALSNPHLHRNTTAYLSKGWKPYKVELKGSKLHFFKPPSDRSNGVKELFPITCVPAEDGGQDTFAREDEPDVPAAQVAKLKGSEHESPLGGRKRALWGRRTHPDLVLENENITAGSLEALINEAVFATTFHVSSEPAAPNSQEAETQDKEDDDEAWRVRWQDLASAVMFGLPILVGPTKFEPELFRCCSYFVNGAGDSGKEAARSRARWLIGEYLRFHRVAIDMAALEEWRAETVPDVPMDVLLDAPFSSISMSPEPQVAEEKTGDSQDSSASPLVPTSPRRLAASPNIQTFSPRPDVSAKLQSLSSALSSPRADGFAFASLPKAPASPSSPAALERYAQKHHANAAKRRILWDVLEREGLSREVLQALNPHLIAHSLTTFHRGMFNQIPGNLTAAALFCNDEPKDLKDQSNEDGLDDATDPAKVFTYFFGSDTNPHWLTKVVLVQVLGADTSSGRLSMSLDVSSSPASDDHNGSQTSRLHSRSDVISTWVKVGELCRSAGDECSWRAIVAALCSPPVARLDKAWRRVDSSAIASVVGWVHPLIDNECSSVRQPACTPWGGNMRAEIQEALNRAAGDETAETAETWDVKALVDARDQFDALRRAFFVQSRGSDENLVSGDDVEKMVDFWRQLSSADVPGAKTKFTQINHFMALSFAAEPRRKGLFEPLYWTSPTSSSQLPFHPLTPLLFPEPLPTLTLIDRSHIYRGRSDSGPPVPRELLPMRALGAPLQSNKEQKKWLFNSHELSSIPRPGDLGGTVIDVFDGELSLVAQTYDDNSVVSRPPSRPPSSVGSGAAEKMFSRSPSIRVKPGSSKGLDRKTSVARRSSLPSISPKINVEVSEQPSERPLRVVVRAGTLDRLVNILVHGLASVLVSVADDNGEMPLRERKTRELVIDYDEFADVWWQVYRSFVSPFVFFELLRKRYINSKPLAGSADADVFSAVYTRFQILGTIMSWIQVGGGAQDALDDIELTQAIRNFLSDSDKDIILSKLEVDRQLLDNMESLSRKKISLFNLFTAHTMRPLLKLPLYAMLSYSKRGNYGKEPPDVDTMTAKDLVDNLDTMFAAAFSNVSEEDLFVTSDLLEVQTADRLGWFMHRDSLSTSEDIEIQTIYSHILDLEPSSLISGGSHDSLYRLFPPGIRSCIRAYGILRKWLISKLVTLKLGLHTRQSRMDLYLRAIEIARWRTSLRTLSGESGCIRSFVETVLVSAILSPESRLYQRAWQNIASNRGSSVETLSGMLSGSARPTESDHHSLTVDLGWLLERLLEIISIPNILSSSDSGQSLVNLEKRRRLCNFILNVPSLSFRTSRPEVDRRDFDHLTSIEKEVTFIRFDFRAIKEDSYRENSQAGALGQSPARKSSRPFYKIVVMQQEKNKRDKLLRDRSSRERRLEEQDTHRREDHVNRAMALSPRGASKQLKQHRSKKSMSSAFFQFMRPISSAFTSDSLHALEVRKTPAELDFKPSGKPSLVLNVVGCRVAQFANAERSFIFRLDTEDGGHYLLQAISRREQTKWLDVITRVSQTMANRRLTYLGNSPKPQLSDHITNISVGASQDPGAVFGVSLEVLMKRQLFTSEDVSACIPFVIDRCLSEVENRGLQEVGIYRIAGAASEINALREAFNRGECPIRPSTDIHAVCDLIKSWFRVLPEALFPATHYHDAIEATKLENLDERIARMRAIVHALPGTNFHLLKRVAEHLDKVTDYEEYNQMSAEALAIVFSPNLLRAPRNDFAMILANMGHTHKLVKALITHFHTIFDDEGDQDDDEQDGDNEIDSPILEEDEDELHSPQNTLPDY